MLGVQDLNAFGGALPGSGDQTCIRVDENHLFVVAQQLFSDLETQSFGAEHNDRRQRGHCRARYDAIEDQGGGGKRWTMGHQDDHRVDRFADDPQISGPMAEAATISERREERRKPAEKVSRQLNCRRNNSAGKILTRNAAKHQETASSISGIG